MADYDEEDIKLCDEVHAKISLMVRNLMEELWENWSHLGYTKHVKRQNITILLQYEEELHREMLNDVRSRVEKMQEEVEELKEEYHKLSEYLAVDITIPQYHDDMMLDDYKKELELQISGHREQVKQRQMKINRLLEWQRDLEEKLGVSFPDLQVVPLPSEEELEKLQRELEVLQAERDKRIEVFLNTQVEVKDIMEKLQIKPQTKFELLVVNSLSVDFKVTDLNMDRLAKLLQDLQEKYEQTNNRVLEMRERLAKLWEGLEEDQIYRENFLEAHQGCHPETEAALNEEIKRCDILKKQKIKVFVSKVRTKIKLMWDALMYSQQERQELASYYQDIYTEDVLDLHQLYLDKITAFYNSNKPIFELVVTRKNLWQKMTELEERASAPGRYHNRGGQLLKEEKERKAISLKLPKIEKQLENLVAEYTARTGKTFTVEGKPLLELMKDEWATRHAERQNKVAARKQALTPATPAQASLANSARKRNYTAAELRSVRVSPTKRRHLVTASASKAANGNSNTLGSALKRSALTTVKKRISGRLAARAVAEGKPGAACKRKLELGGDVGKTPKFNASTLKHKRVSGGKRRSSVSRSTIQSSEGGKDLLENTTTYTDFKEQINEKAVCRSSMATNINNKAEPEVPSIPQKTPRKQPATPVGKAPKINLNVMPLTPKNTMLPPRLSRSLTKLNIAAPHRAPLSGNRQNLPIANSPIAPAKRSKSHTTMHRVKNLPPLM